MEYAANLCHTCLRKSEYLKPLSKEEDNVFKTILSKVDRKLYICLFCRHMLRKVTNFSKQCQIAQEYLQSSLVDDQQPQLECVYNLSISQTNCDYFGVKSTDKDEFDEDDLPLPYLNDDDFIDNAVSPGVKEEVLVFENVVDFKDSHLCKDPIDVQVLKDNKSHRNGMRSKENSIPAGFTSRMVRETDEYTVIKLTKEQVLDEMKSNKHNEKYIGAPYKCEFCVKYFNFEDVLSTHLEKHSPKNGTFKCDICTQYCPSAVSLRGHLKSHTTKYKCKICGIVRLSRQHILEHYVLEHTGDIPAYTCNECEFTTNKRTVMQRHARTHVASDRHTCDVCGRGFKSKETLRVHTTRHDVKKKFSCDTCKRSFIFKSLLQKHIRSVHIDEDLYCVECDIKFTSMEALKQHFKRSKKHTDPSHYKYECKLCSEKFLAKARLDHHETSIHNLPKTSQCDQCSRVYSGPEALRLHVRRAHPIAENRTEYQCGVCCKVFTRKSGLKIHSRIHTGERPYICSCGEAFTQQASLRAHYAAKHKK